jgi:hypothetical protein
MGNGILPQLLPPGSSFSGNPTTRPQSDRLVDVAFLATSDQSHASAPTDDGLHVVWKSATEIGHEGSCRVCRNLDIRSIPAWTYTYTHERLEIVPNLNTP